MGVNVLTKELYSQLMESAKKIGQLAEQEVLAAEQNSSLSQNVVDAIIEAGVNRLIIPKEYGYPQIDFTTYADLVKEVGYYKSVCCMVDVFLLITQCLSNYIYKDQWMKFIKMVAY